MYVAITAFALGVLLLMTYADHVLFWILSPVPFFGLAVAVAVATARDDESHHAADLRLAGAGSYYATSAKLVAFGLILVVEAVVLVGATLALTRGDVVGVVVDHGLRVVAIGLAAIGLGALIGRAARTVTSALGASLATFVGWLFLPLLESQLLGVLGAAGQTLTHLSPLSFSLDALRPSGEPRALSPFLATVGLGVLGAIAFVSAGAAPVRGRDGRLAAMLIVVGLLVSPAYFALFAAEEDDDRDVASVSGVVARFAGLGAAPPASILDPIRAGDVLRGQIALEGPPGRTLSVLVTDIDTSSGTYTLQAEPTDVTLGTRGDLAGRGGYTFRATAVEPGYHGLPFTVHIRVDVDEGSARLSARFPYVVAESLTGVLAGVALAAGGIAAFMMHRRRVS